MSDQDQQTFIRLPTPEELRARPGGARPSSYNFGFSSGMGRLLATHERIGRAMQAAFHEIMFAPGALTRAEREMLAAVASAAQDCQY
jgi:alkylhydroperoxidase/carboxymuconolactone decarboxylase family protein YurZ